MDAALVGSGGGLMTNARGSRGGSTAAPPSLKTSRRLTLRKLPDMAAALPPLNAKLPPQPLNTAMYCSPATSKVLGAAMIPDCANIDHNFSPLSARYTLKFPDASPCATMLPAVVTTPPFHGPL